MAETIDCIEDFETTFTFGRASSASSEVPKSFYLSDNFKSVWRDDDRLENRQGSEGQDFVCPRNRCFTGMGIGALLSILIWAGIFLSIYAVF
jgi:hypothetical protein